MCSDATGRCAVSEKHIGLAQVLPRILAPPLPSRTCPFGRVGQPLGAWFPGLRRAGRDADMRAGAVPGAVVLRPPE